MLKRILMALAIIGLFNTGDNAMAFTLTSTAFSNGNTIPAKYTCDGANISPPLQWQDVPHDTQTFALIMDDPDAPAGTWDHWLLYNIPNNIQQLAEDIKILPADTQIGLNSWRRQKYDGPCPPHGTHRYMFKLYALNNKLDLKDKISKAELMSAIKKHLLDVAILEGRYIRVHDKN